MDLGPFISAATNRNVVHPVMLALQYGVAALHEAGDGQGRDARSASGKSRAAR
jgi:hypothetical protein